MERDELENEDVNNGFYRDSLQDLQSILKTDAYAPGKKHSGAYPDDITDAIEHILFIEEHKEVTIKVSKDADNYHLVFEIVNRLK